MVSKSEMKRINVQRGGTSEMTDQTKVLEIAKECGAVINIKHHLNVDGDSIVFVPEELLAFAAALEAEYLAQIAMLRNELTVVERFFPTGSIRQIAVANALSATQQTADAFVARVRAEALEEAKKQFPITDDDDDNWYGIYAIHGKLQQMIDKLGNSAAQPEGKEGGE